MPRGRTARYRSTLLTIAIAFATIAPAIAAQADPPDVCAGSERQAFQDVPMSSTHGANIDCIAAYGIAVGVGGGNYGPSQHVRRGQMASYLVNLLEVALGEELPAPPGVPRFTDVVGTTHGTNILVAAQQGITSGRTPTTYEPGGLVTRAQMATFVAKTIQAAGASLPSAPPNAFTDDNGSTHEANIDALAAVGIVVGTGGGAYAPGAPVTRAQMATYLVNTAAYLATQGAWDGSLVEADTPVLQLAIRHDDRDDHVELRFDRSVTFAGVAGDVEVFDEANAAKVTEAVSATGGQPGRIVLELQSDLTPGAVYWVRLPEGVVVDEDETPNLSQQLAFTFGAGGGGGGGAVETGPAISDVVTDPANDRLIVTFSEQVTCPDTASARAAWNFTNQSVIESGLTQAGGSPNTVTQPGGGPDLRCYLNYTGEGIEDGDFGTLAYTSPVTASHRVTDTADDALSTVNDIDVKDGQAPSFLAIAAASDTNRVTLLFSEPVLCSSLSADSFELAVEGVVQPGAITGFSCLLAMENPAMNVAGGTFGPGDVVRVTVVGDVNDQSADNSVPASTVRIANAT